ncbi:hypothetical protein KDL44_15725 [bacterium]|nr:hypothetical protein [bacterium]
MTEKLVSYVSGRTLATFWLMLAVFAALLAFAFIPNSSPLKQAVSSAFLPTVGLLAALGISEIIFVMRERNCSGMLRAFLLLAGISVVGTPLSILLHNVVSYLLKLWFSAPEEGVFFVLALFVFPVLFLVSVIGVIWQLSAEGRSALLHS